MSYTPLTDVKTELEDLNTEQDSQTILQTSLRDLINELLEEQRLTNKLLKKIYNPE